MDDIAAFITARARELEAAAKAAESAFSLDASEPRKARSPWIAAGSLLLAAQPDGSHADIAEAVNYGLNDVLAHAALNDPHHILGLAGFMRAILAEHLRVGGSCRICINWPPDPWPCRTVRLLAAVDSGHPDYKATWKP